MELKELIEKITPFYNQYRKNQKILNGAEALDIIWEVGDLLKKYLSNHDIAPDALYRKIYGKSEQATNVEQKSYITREFLSRSYRIRKIFINKSKIKEELPGLQRFRQFFQAMPFFDNPKYRIAGGEKEELLSVLNSNKTNQQIMVYIHKLQKEKIGIKNPRTQRLQELSTEKQFFIDLYNFIYKNLKEKKYSEAKKNLGSINQSFISELSKNTGALASDQLRIQSFDIPGDIGGPWLQYAEMVNTLATKKDAKERRRFRRLIPPVKMMRLSEMIYALRSEEDFNKFRL